MKLQTAQTPTLEQAGVTWLGCICDNEQRLASIVDALEARGIGRERMRMGCADPPRAQAVAAQVHVVADLDPSDPLRGVGGLLPESATRKAVDNGGVWGAAIGVVVGALLGYTPVADLIQVSQGVQRITLLLLSFIIGVIVGSVLGAAFSRQSSTHAGFRLIDGMQDGGFALLISLQPEEAEEVQRALEAAGATGITRI